MNEFPLVSVIIPCFNCEKYVKDAVMSIVNQTYKNLEIILCDDCSTDNTKAILRILKEYDCRIKLIEHIENKKLISTLNEMVYMARGKYVARMDADDISDLKRIELQVNYMESNSSCSICGTNITLIDNNNKNIGLRIMPHTYDDIRVLMPYNNMMCHPTVIARAEVLKKNPYSIKYIHAEDYELWCRLIYKQKLIVHNLNYFGLKYRINGNQISTKYGVEQKRIASKIVEDYSLIVEDKEIYNLIFSGKESVVDNYVLEKYINDLLLRLNMYNLSIIIDIYMKILVYLYYNNIKLFIKYIIFSKALRYTLINILKKRWRNRTC